MLDAARLGEQATRFARRAADNPYVLEDLGEPVPEFAAARVGALEQRWAAEVLR